VSCWGLEAKERASSAVVGSGWFLKAGTVWYQTTSPWRAAWMVPTRHTTWDLTAVEVCARLEAAPAGEGRREEAWASSVCASSWKRMRRELWTTVAHSSIVHLERGHRTRSGAPAGATPGRGPRRWRPAWTPGPGEGTPRRAPLPPGLSHGVLGGEECEMREAADKRPAYQETRRGRPSAWPRTWRGSCGGASGPPETQQSTVDTTIEEHSLSTVACTNQRESRKIDPFLTTSSLIKHQPRRMPRGLNREARLPA